MPVLGGLCCRGCCCPSATPSSISASYDALAAGTFSPGATSLPAVEEEPADQAGKKFFPCRRMLLAAGGGVDDAVCTDTSVQLETSDGGGGGINGIGG